MCLLFTNISEPLHHSLYSVETPVRAFSFFFFKCYGPPRNLPFSPTRRSPDLSRPHPPLLEGRLGPGGRAGLSPDGIERSLRAGRAAPVGQHQFRDGPRRLHPRRSRGLHAEADRKSVV